MFNTGAYLTALFLGMGVGVFLVNSNPHLKCEQKYETPEDISECVWILENGIR